ncbi:hypothetical protein [Nonomuraea endophytica]|uniref:Uncharacterized protein n=1 Tax=Nonomuraea endophytica TaxID=714136 RepID=A0A7W8A871_9ACTN|nr:hypothetical protein [Nonomuraea endophytica]MBB5081344.1 hypothetical protein [Nonomuraea endophytica]
MTTPTRTDWRGNPYTTGTTVLYARRISTSCEIAEGVVIDIYDAVRDARTNRWARADPDNPNHQTITGRDRETRVIVQPTGRESKNWRLNTRQARNENWIGVYDEHGSPIFEPVEHGPVALTALANITVITP